MKKIKREALIKTIKEFFNLESKLEFVIRFIAPIIGIVVLGIYTRTAIHDMPMVLWLLFVIIVGTVSGWCVSFILMFVIELPRGLLQDIKKQQDRFKTLYEKNIEEEETPTK